MAPALTSQAPTAPHELGAKKAFPNHKAPRDIYPDGIKTSGQHPPLYDVLHPYEDFPREITGSTVWNVEEYRGSTLAEFPYSVSHFTDKIKYRSPGTVDSRLLRRRSQGDL